MLLCVVFLVQYQMDTEQLSENLSRLNKNLDPKIISKMSNSETLLQLEVRELFQTAGLDYKIAQEINDIVSEYYWYQIVLQTISKTSPFPELRGGKRVLFMCGHLTMYYKWFGLVPASETLSTCRR